MVSEWKENETKELKKLLKEYKVFGVVNIDNIPARQMQQMRSKLRDKLLIRVTRNTLMKRTLGKKDIKNYVNKNTGFIFTNMDSFRLCKLLERGKAPAPAKGGEIAPQDIVVPKGDTGFPPGPMIGELQKVGIPAQVEKGKIHVKKDTVVAKKEDVISKDLASALTKLGIQPMEVGLNLIATYEDDTVFLADVLKVDDEQVKNSIIQSYNEAMNLALYAGITNKETISTLIGKAHRETVSLALELNLVNKETVGIILSKAYKDALTISSKIK
jgi:large subunit ribosomal protein L10